MGLAADAAGPWPFLRVELPVLGGRLAAAVSPGAALFEVWRGVGPVRAGEDGPVRFAHDGQRLLGLLRLPDAADLGPVAGAAYRHILRAATEAGYPALLRVHNHLPRITGQEGGGERYRRFNAGRREAFAAAGAAAEAGAPAATAVGTAGGAVTLVFLAARGAGRAIENPRQVSAYRYPGQYGTVAPNFSRAMLAGGTLFVSGTASIVGHASLHPGDAGAQAAEVARNLRAVLAACADGGAAPDLAGLVLKVYLRDPADRGRVAAVLGDAGFGGAVVFLHAQVCRPELLVEAEGECPAG